LFFTANSIGAAGHLTIADNQLVNEQLATVLQCAAAFYFIVPFDLVFSIIAKLLVLSIIAKLLVPSIIAKLLVPSIIAKLLVLSIVAKLLVLSIVAKLRLLSIIAKLMVLHRMKRFAIGKSKGNHCIRDAGFSQVACWLLLLPPVFR
jgi:hypothetical protein